ncbi:MAG: FAD-binding oxidoreductase [Rhodobacteraceae bacterium]|nr:FAD-binding oxidoreductase [Paracoccaceae bacterium]
MTQPSQPARSADVVVIGGGIHGSSAALYLAQRGLSVIVLEKDSVGRHASGVNAGGVRRLGRHLAEVPIAVRSRRIWATVADFLGDDCGFEVAPQMRLARSEEHLVAMRARVAEMQALGYHHEVMIGTNQIREYIHSLSDEVVGAVACLDDGFAQPYQTTFAIHRKARALGARFHEGVRALGLTREAGGDWRVATAEGDFTAPRVLLAGGLWSGEISATLGEPVPIIPFAPMMLVTTRLPPFCNAVVGAAGVPLSFKQMPNGTVVIGGGRPGRPDAATNRAETTFHPLRLSAQTCISLFPIMAEASVVRTWAGLEAEMPDQIPVVGPSLRHEGLYYAFGFSGHGFQLGLGMGEIMAELIATGATDVDLAPFSIGRFTGGAPAY